MKRSLALMIFGCVLCLPVGVPVAAADEKADSAQIEFFERKIRPVLVEHCYECHSADSETVEGELMLDTREGIRRGGESGEAIVPGKAAAGSLLAALRYEATEMPPDGKLSDEIITDFERWIQMGATDPRDGKSILPVDDEIDFVARRQFWSFQPPVVHASPTLSQPIWVQQPIDAFVLARLDAAGLKPNPRASRRELVRRLSYDLIGLPPTSAEFEAFEQDKSSDAYGELVNRLLASPHYGERWARMWLDVSRYAEDQAHIVGDNRALCYPNAYMYRDWVIGAFNDDMPYDRFVRLQLAADLIEPDDSTHHVALGFIGLGPKYYRRNAPEVKADEWEDRVDTVSRGLLGLTVACARCHDHKFDPIPTEDYYAMAGVFASTQMFNRPLDDKAEKNKSGEAKKAENAIHILRDKKPHDLKVFLRGNHKHLGEVARRAFLKILSPDTPVPFKQGSGRAELAAAITSRQNPLTARVIVNRIWTMHFGQSLVGTPSNFGALGERPTHPLLLDDLAVRFMEAGWSMKWLHREILMSATWQQSSQLSAANEQIDADNRLLWRMRRRRLDVEAWRDSILMAAGRLDLAVGGKSIDPEKPDVNRRTVYSYVSRLDLNPLLARFDFPDPNAHSARRVETTTPLQKMFILNSPFMVRQTEAFAARCNELPGDDGAKVRWAYRTLWGRDPNSEEAQLAAAFLGDPADTEQHASHWEQFAQVLLASNEMLLID